MHILVLTPVGDFRGGAERSVLSSIEALVEAEYRVTLVTSNKGEFSDRLAKLGVTIYFTGTPDKYLCIGKRNFIGAIQNTLRTNYLVHRINKKHAIDLIYCNDALTLEWCILFLLQKRKKPKVVIHERLCGVGPVHRFNYLLLKGKFFVIFTSSFMERCISSHFSTPPWKGAEILHNPVAVPANLAEVELSALRIRDRLGLMEHDKLLCYVGRFAALKNIHHAVTAIAMLPPEKRPHFLIVGKASGNAEKRYEQYLLDIIVRYKLKEHVHFAGYHSRVDPFIKAGDALVILSTNESFGRTVIEAQRLGVPVIGASVGGIPEIMDKRLGVLVDVVNVKQIAAAINRVLDTEYDGAFRKEVAIDVCNRFHTKTYKNRFIKVIRSYLTTDSNHANF